MYLGKIVGTLWATQKTESLTDLRFQVVNQLNLDMEETGNYVIAVDSVGSGVGEVILYAQGSSARQTPMTNERPVDAVIMAIVDSFDVNDEVRFRK